MSVCKCILMSRRSASNTSSSGTHSSLFHRLKGGATELAQCLIHLSVFPLSYLTLLLLLRNLFFLLSCEYRIHPRWIK